MTKLAGKTALIVGEFAPFGAGSAVTGVVSNEWAIALECAREGAAVMVADKDPDVADAVATALRDEGHRADAVACDVTDAAQCQAAVAATVARFGALNLLVNTVGAVDLKTIDQITAEEFEKALRVNVLGQFHVMKPAVVAMRAAGSGAIVNISSLSAIRTGGAGIGYETTKAALLALARNVALSEAGANIRVNSLLPGVLDSASFRQMVGPDTSSFAERVPVRRLGTPWEFAKAVTFLLSDEASYITAASLLLDGGMAWGV